MADEFAPLNPRARLATLQDRIAQARASLEAHGIKGEQLAVLTDLIEKHDAIRGSLEAQATVISAQTDALEASLDRWLQNVENKFANPAGRNPSALV